MTNKESILGYLQSIYPDSATNSDIRDALKFNNHQDVFYPTRDLKDSRVISATRIGREWHFKAKESASAVSNPLPAKQKPPKIQQLRKMTAKNFENLVREKLSGHFQSSLTEKSVPGIGKRWDMVSSDGSIVGDAKYYTLVRGKALPPAKFATIAEHVWLLEKTNADIKFLVFGNQIEVPQLWLKKYGTLVSDVNFYFMDDEGNIEQIN
jgi:hypothetical protein